jgi:deoxyadenosine/deoxycytidine kinase
MLISMKTGADVLRSRLAERNRRFDANAQFQVTGAILNQFLESFEEPIGEGETVVLDGL